MGLSYRLQQFWRGLTAGPLTAEAQQELDALLSPAEKALFEQYSRADQWHCIRVVWTLRQAGHDEPDLLRAALLHDVGKSRAPLNLWDRTVIVATEAVAPEKAEAWGQAGDGGWRRPFIVRFHHPAWGAEMATAAGSNDIVVELIRRHAEDGQWDEQVPVERLLAALQWADDQN